MNTLNKIFQLCCMLGLLASILTGVFYTDEAFLGLLYIAFFMGFQHLILDIVILVSKNKSKVKRKLHFLHLLSSLILIATIAVFRIHIYEQYVFWIFPCILAIGIWYSSFFIPTQE